VNKANWQRRAARFDEVTALPVSERTGWLAKLRTSEPDEAAAIEKMLAEYAHAEATDELVNSEKVARQAQLLGVATGEFEAYLDAATADDFTLAAGEDIGAWRLIEKIGEGGMGAVWLADRKDGNFEGRAAIKVLRAGFSKANVVERFLRERRLLARLTHPGIARMLDAGAHRGEPYLVMEYIEGEVITKWASVHAPLVADRVKLIIEVCRAVEHAHGQLIIHRDLKPSNVMVNAAGQPKLLDFGIAKLIDDDDDEYGTALTRMTGRGYTLGYCAPEQITGEPTGVAADVFSIGVLLFELLTGVMPYKAEHEGRTALEHAIVHLDAISLGRALDNAANANQPQDVNKARGDIEAIVAKALRKKPQDRYATVSALADDLAAWLSQTPISIRREDRQYRTKLWVKRNWPLAALGSVTLVAVIAGLGVSVWQRSQALAAASLAKEEAARANKVADYLGELIQSASPDNHGGNWPTVLALLEQSEKDLDKKFADDPKTHAVLLKKLADTNDALNRNPTALAQLTQLHALLVKTQPPDSDDAMDALKQQAQLLRRMSRYGEAMEIDEALLPKFIKRYGPRSEEVGKLLMGTAITFAEKGDMDQAKSRMVGGAAILSKLYPEDLAKRVDMVNDAAVMLTRQAMWREAANTLTSIEGELPAFAALGGQAVRDSLIMRRNLEAIRIRVGSYAGVEERLKKILAEFDALLGQDNVHSALAMYGLRGLYCETGRMEQCLAMSEALTALLHRRAGDIDGNVVEADIIYLTQQLRMGRASTHYATVQLPMLFAAIPAGVPQGGAERAETYRHLSDAAVAAGMLPLAEAARQRAREDLAKINNANPERVAQVDRAEALAAFVRGDTKRAVQLLEPRFKLYEKSAEGDSPRRAALWLQRALFELEFDAKAAAVSLRVSRDMFDRLGGAKPHLAALLGYADARIGGDKAAIRAAEEAVDRAWFRPHPRAPGAPWQMPLMPSV
jgi:eukaryotic-like serine/threonine-protein kinase